MSNDSAKYHIITTTVINFDYYLKDLNFEISNYA